MVHYPYYHANDPSLATHLAAVPSAVCPAPACSDGPSSHLDTWLHGSSLLAFSFCQLPAEHALPGADHGQIWFWMRRHEVGHLHVPTNVWLIHQTKAMLGLRLLRALSA